MYIWTNQKYLKHKSKYLHLKQVGSTRIKNYIYTNEIHLPHVYFVLL